MKQSEENTNQIKPTIANLARFIETSCKNKKISATKLADKSGLGKNYITRLRSGKIKSMPKVETLKAIAKALQIKPEILLAKAGYTIERFYKPVLGEVIVNTASELGLSNNLANSLADVVNAVLLSKSQEAVARAWFEEMVACYVYDKAHEEGMTNNEVEYLSGVSIDLINYSKKQEFNIEDIDV